MWAEVGGELSAEAGEGGPRDVRAAESRYGFASACHDEDRAASLVRHVGGDGCGDRVVCAERLGHGLHELVEGELEERLALDVVVGGCVEAHIDGATRVGYADRVLLYRVLVKHIELGGGCDAASAANHVHDRFETRPSAAGECT